MSEPAPLEASAALPRISICGVAFTPLAREQLHELIVARVRRRERTMVLHVNVHAINLAQGDSTLRQILNSAPVVFCDGFGVRLGARILGHRVPPRITYADWIWQLGALAEQHGMRLFLLGARPGVAQQAATRLLERFPQLAIVGVHHGYFDQTAGSSASVAVVAAINAAQPDIVLVSLGMPRQERWLDAHWPQLQASIGLTGGAALDYAAGKLRRGPRWMTTYGLEWLARLIIEPRRLWRRYIMGNPIFLLRVLRQRFGRPEERL